LTEDIEKAYLDVGNAGQRVREKEVELEKLKFEIEE